MSNVASDIKILLHKMAEEPDIRRHWVQLSQSYLNSGDHLSCYWAAKKALEITNHKSHDNPICWGTWPYDLAGTAAYYIGLHNESLEQYITAWRMEPKNDRLIGNVKLVRRHLNKYRIHLLWPTVRPDVFKERYGDWMSKASNEDRIKLTIAVNTRKQREELYEFENVLIIGSDHPGVAYATYMLAKDLDGFPDDIVVLASDDFYPPEDWDAFIYSEMNEFSGCLLVNDAKNPSRVRRDCVVTIPIMDFSCLIKLNRFIYHPSYCHLWSDQELFDNIKALDLLKDVASENIPVFEHKHWYHGMRNKDDTDSFIDSMMDRDKQNYIDRSGMSLDEKLSYQK